MKNAYSYKAVVYQHTSLTNGFWTGRAVDKQIESREREVSQYWINDFLDTGSTTFSIPAFELPLRAGGAGLRLR